MLERAAITETVAGREWTLDLPDGLSRSIYEGCKDFIVGAGGRWVRTRKTHVFSRDPRPLLADVLGTGKVRNLKAERQAFYTPAPLAALVAETALSGVPLRATLRVLEPSAGDGALLRGLRAVRGGAKLLDVVAIESDPDALESLRRELGQNYGRACLIAQDFLDVPAPSLHADQFDRVVMNPPFAHKQELEHVMHAHSFLRTGGLLVAVMSAGVDFRSESSYERFRVFVDFQGGRIQRLPSGSFQESGTNVETCLVTIPN